MVEDEPLPLLAVGARQPVDGGEALVRRLLERRRGGGALGQLLLGAARKEDLGDEEARAERLLEPRLGLAWLGVGVGVG